MEFMYDGGIGGTRGNQLEPGGTSGYKNVRTGRMVKSLVLTVSFDFASTIKLCFQELDRYLN